MSTAILCFNVGSSSLAFALFGIGGDGLVLRATGGVDLSADSAVRLRPADGPQRTLDVSPRDFPAAATAALDALSETCEDEIVVAHRIVHGGERHVRPARLDSETIEELDRLTPLAPIHQPANLGPARAIAEARPDTAQVGVFDTAFHATLPGIARRLPLPETDATSGLRRFGFHGLSYAGIARHMAREAPERRRIVALHLSGGASACAIRDGASVDTTMGATPLDGIMMGTRSGAVDPGALLALLESRGMSVDELHQMLWHDSGLAGVSGVSRDTRDLMASDDPRAAAAIDLYCRQAAKAVASMAVSLGGLDALVFTGGAGAESAPIRARICADLGFLGVVLDPDANDSGAEIVSPPAATVEIRAVAPDEERTMAEDTLAFLKEGSA